MLPVLEWLLLPIGLFGTIWAYDSSRLYRGTGQALGEAFRWSFIAKSIACGTTTLFASTTIVGLYQELHPVIVLILRYVIFIALIASVIVSRNALRKVVSDG